MKHEEDGIVWYDNLTDAKEEGYIPVRAWSVLQFFNLKGKTSTLVKANLEPMRYVYYALHSASENRYYKKLHRAYDIDTLYFYRPTLTFSGQDEAVKNLRRYIDDKNVTILYTPPQVEDTKKMLERVWKANISVDGQLPYRDFINLLKLSLDYEDYKIVGKNLLGFKTVCSQYDIQLRTIWAQLTTTDKSEKDEAR